VYFEVQQTREDLHQALDGTRAAARANTGFESPGGLPHAIGDAAHEFPEGGLMMG